MMRQFAFAAVAVAGFFCKTTTADALPASLVDRAQRATALLDVNTAEGRAFGSAFCISDAGLFVTDGHVVAGSTGDIKVVIRPGEQDQKVAIAHVLGIDYTADLAILQADNPGPVPKLTLGNSDAVVATEEVTAFGYPFGNMLALDKDTYPSVTVNSGKVTALRKEKGDLALIQVDALVNPGNSGGPVMDSEGRVIGIVESGVQGAGVNFATPVTRLKKMMNGPLVLIDPLSVPYPKRNTMQTFSIHVNSLTHSSANYDVDFKITDAKGKVTTVSGKTIAGICKLEIVPTTDTAAIKWNPFMEEPPAFKFSMSLSQSQKVVGTQDGSIYLSDIPLDGPLTNAGKPKKGGSDRLDPLPANAEDTALIGAAKLNEFRQIGAVKHLARGFEATPAHAGNQSMISSVKLLYDSAGDDKQAIVAKDGYVVGGLNVGTSQYSTGVFVTGLQVIFIRAKGGVLDPTDTYTSDWIGVTPKEGKEKQIAGKGEKVLGLHWRKGTYVRAIGLVVEKPVDSAQP